MKYKIEILTPVHIGSGQKLGKIDKVYENGKLYVIDVEKIIETLKEKAVAFFQVDPKDSNMNAFLKNHNINLKNVIKYEIKAEKNPQSSDILEILKTGTGHPIIPGSSIKGAIRTVLFNKLVKENQNEVNKKLDEITSSNSKEIKKNEADDKIIKFLFGKEPQEDFMKSIQISDAQFNINDVELREINILDLKNNYIYGWFSSKKILDNPQSATHLFAEIIKENASSTIDFKIDYFYIEKKFNNRKSLLENIPKICNEYVDEYIKSEIEFFERCKMQIISKFYNDLKNQIPKNNNEFLLRLGWGIGWNAITGNVWKNQSLQTIRNKFKLGKGKIFPKTRKILFEKNDPICPLGWIKLTKLE